MPSDDSVQRICDGWKYINRYWMALPQSDRNWVSESAQQIIDNADEVPLQETIDQMLWLAGRVKDAYQHKKK